MGICPTGIIGPDESSKATVNFTSHAQISHMLSTMSLEHSDCQIMNLKLVWDSSLLSIDNDDC